MKQITLCDGKKVDMQLTVSSVRAVKNVLDIDLMKLDEKGSMAIHEMIESPMDLCNVMYLLCKKSCDAQDITDENFGEGLDGDAIADATKVFLEELTNFYPLRQRTLFKQSLETIEEMQGRMLEMTTTRLGEMKEGLMEQVQKEVDKSITLKSLQTSLAEQKQS